MDLNNITTPMVGSILRRGEALLKLAINTKRKASLKIKKTETTRPVFSHKLSNLPNTHTYSYTRSMLKITIFCLLYKNYFIY